MKLWIYLGLRSFYSTLKIDSKHISIGVDEYQFLFPISQELERPSLLTRHTVPTINKPTGEFTKG